MAKDDITYEIVGPDDSVVAKVWWDSSAESLESDSSQMLDFLKQKHHNNVTFHDGEKFLKMLPRIFNTGYMYARRVHKK